MKYDSVTIRACKALLDWKFNNKLKNKQSYFADKHCVSVAYVNKINAIRNSDERLFNELLQGKKLNIKEISRNPTSNVTAILNYILKSKV